MRQSEKLDFKREDDEYMFFETRIDCPPEARPELMHFIFGPHCYIMMAPIREGYEHNPVQLLGMVFCEKKDIHNKSEEDIRKLVRENFPGREDIEPRIRFS